jgi:hypothetical protein
MAQADWSPSAGYKVGDKIKHTFRRSWLDIWWERVTTLRWHVNITERRTFLCTSVSPGSIWPEVRD